MAQKCQVCINGRCKIIDMRLIEGVDTLLKLSKEFGVSISSLFHHKKYHLKLVLQRQQLKKQEKINEEVADYSDKLDAVKQVDLTELVRKVEFGIEEFTSMYKEARAGNQNLLAIKALNSYVPFIQVLINLQSMVFANRQIELEIAKTNIGQTEEQKQLQYEQEISILTLHEMLVAEALANKIKGRTTDVLIDKNFKVSIPKPGEINR